MPQVPPRETRAPRMGPLAVLPIFLDLAGKRVVVAAAGDAAVWKAELAAAAGAHVQVFTPDPCADLGELSQTPPAGSVAIVQRRWRAGDLAGAALAIGALAGEEAQSFAAVARRHGVPVNIVDTPELSTFSFGCIVNRSPVVIGIGTDGAAPVLAQAIRGKIEALLHPALGAWAAAARRLRAAVKARLPMGPARRDLWGRFADQALAARAGPTGADLRDLPFADARECGSVALVGAGPGDPELLTLKALRALQSADVILYDRLVSPEILELARREARRMLVGKAGGGASCRQDDINTLMVALARDGKRVVRLKGGDPMLFGRAAEELAACRNAGIAVEVIPGITAALGAAAELQMPLTDRRHTRRVQFVAGHAEAGGAPAHDWPSLADPWTVTAFYMSARTFADMLPKLVAAGLDPATPALAISAATTPRSTRIACAVADLPAALAERALPQPCLILLGKGVAHARNQSAVGSDQMDARLSKMNGGSKLIRGRASSTLRE
jgi:uroporphyrin-III C-methyltransferase/precorrin-2 dehydrogenase/sirohydrochlorin ferrochelatase